MNFPDPVQAFDAVIAALRAGDWHGAASFCDEASLRLVQRYLALQFAPPIRLLTVEDMRAHNPDLPLEVAAFQAAEHNRLADPADRLARDLPGIADVAALRALTPAAAMAAWLDGQSVERQAQWQGPGARMSAEELAAVNQIAAFRFDLVALGWVPEGEALAHVVYGHAPAAGVEHPEVEEDVRQEADRMEAGLGPLSDGERVLLRERRAVPPSIVTCRRQPDGGWRLVATLHAFPGVSEMLFGISRDGERDGSDEAAATPADDA